MAKKKFSFAPLAIAFVAATAVTLALRIIQYFTSMENYTGFFKKTDAGIIVFYAVIAAAVVFFIAGAFSKRKAMAFDSTAGRRPGAGILSCLLGVAVFISVYQEYAFKDVDTSAYTVSTATAASGSWLVYAVCLTGLVSGVYFIALGIMYLLGRSNGSAYRYLSLVPPLWCVVRLVVRFTRTVSYLRVSDLLLEMLALCAFSVFLMSFARLVGNVNPEGCEWKLVASGLAGAMLGIVCFIPRAIMTVSGNAQVIFVLSRADVSDIAMALFMLCIVFTKIMPGAHASVESEEPASILI